MQRVVKENRQLYSTINVGLSILTRALSNEIEEIPESLKGLVNIHLEEQRQLLKAIISKPIVLESLMRKVITEPHEETLLSLKTALKAVSTPGAEGFFRLLLIPTTKIYELYVLIKIIQALGEDCRFLRHDNLNIIRTKRGIIYYNRPPKNFSRLVYKLSRTVPHPDITLEVDDNIIVLDAKYRENLEGLELREALRLVGYVTDLAKDTQLKAIVACLSKRIDRIATTLNDLQVDISIIEINPLKDIEELTSVLI